MTIHPAPEITWYHNGKRLRDVDKNEKYKEGSEIGLYKLTISDCDFKDGGDILVLAKNSHGDDTSKANLIIKSKPFLSILSGTIMQNEQQNTKPVKIRAALTSNVSAY